MYTHYDRAANAVGCNHPPGFKSPILRFLSSGSALTFIAGRPLFRAFRASCVAMAVCWPLFPSHLLPALPHRRAGFSHALIPL